MNTEECGILETLMITEDMKANAMLRIVLTVTTTSILNVTDGCGADGFIQDGIHCPVQDARAAMELYKKQWKMNGPAPRTRRRKDEPQQRRKTYECYFDKCDVGYEYETGDCRENDDGVDYLSLDYQNDLFDYVFYD